MTPTITGIAVAAALVLTWMTLGFGAFILLALAMAAGAIIGRIVAGDIEFSGSAGHLQGKALLLMTMTETTPTPTRKNEWEKLPGRTKIAPRALDRVVSAVTADALGVNSKKVSVDLNDDGGNLSLTVSAPIRVPVASADRERTRDR